MTVQCPLCLAQMEGVERVGRGFDGRGWTMLECKHCGASGTSNLVLMHLKALDQLRQVQRALGSEQLAEILGGR